MEKLTKEQQDFVEKNHNLIYSFMNMKKISEDEYYDLLAIALCNAVMSYDETKGSFSTFAYRCMNNCIIRNYKYKKRKIRIPESEIIPYNGEEYDEENPCYVVSLNQFYIDDYITGDIVAEEIMGIFDDRERRIVELILDGYDVKYISKEMEYSTAYIYSLLKKIRAKINRYMRLYN